MEKLQNALRELKSQEEVPYGDQKSWIATIEQRADAYFTGAVRVDLLLEAPDPARVQVASVTFEPGARTAWHNHPLAQTLIVTSGCGWVQSEGGPKREIRPGDVVWFPPGEKHWHGATASTALTHIAIQRGAGGQGRGVDGKGF